MCAADNFRRRHFMMYLLGMVPGHSENLGNIQPKIDTEFHQSRFFHSFVLKVLIYIYFMHVILVTHVRREDRSHPLHRPLHKA